MLKLAESKESGPHYELRRLVGAWSGTAKTWFEPDKIADESPVQGSMRPILDGRFIQFEYTGAMQGKPLEGMAIIGYHLGLEKYQVAWVDSFHTGAFILFSEGNKDNKAMDVLGSYAWVTPEETVHWGWRTSFELRGDDEMVITAYNITPDGEEAKATESVLIRRA